jgi:hypothetical protein
MSRIALARGETMTGVLVYGSLVPLTSKLSKAGVPSYKNSLIRIASSKPETRIVFDPSRVKFARIVPIAGIITDIPDVLQTHVEPRLT